MNRYERKLLRADLTLQLAEGAKVHYADASLNPDDLTALLYAAQHDNVIMVGPLAVYATVLRIDGDVRVELDHTSLVKNTAALLGKMTIKVNAEKERHMLDICRQLGDSPLGPNPAVWALLSCDKMDSTLSRLLSTQLMFYVPLFQDLLSDAANYAVLERMALGDSDFKELTFRVNGKVVTYI